MEIRQTRDTLSDTYVDALRIRNTVFVKEQGVPHNIEVDSDEPMCIHFVLYDDSDTAVATVRLKPEKDGSVYLQRMAVLDNYRNKGFGREILQGAIKFARDNGYSKIALHAQLPAVPFYKEMGFVTEGPVFEEAGIDHVNMVMDLNKK